MARQSPLVQASSRVRPAIPVQWLVPALQQSAQAREPSLEGPAPVRNLLQPLGLGCFAWARARFAMAPGLSRLLVLGHAPTDDAKGRLRAPPRWQLRRGRARRLPPYQNPALPRDQAVPTSLCRQEKEMVDRPSSGLTPPGCVLVLLPDAHFCAQATSPKVLPSPSSVRLLPASSSARRRASTDHQLLAPISPPVPSP